MTIKIEMGTTAERGKQTEPAVMDVEELLATRLLVQGNSGSGKSHLLRRLLEQSAPFVQQAIIDPEGDFVSLADKFGHVVVDASRGEAELETIATRARQHRVSVVLNLESLEAEGQMKAAACFLNSLFDAERDFWFPMLVVVDEAQLFAPAAAGEVSEEARRASLGAMTNLMCRGRKRGLAGIIATQRLAKLAKNVAAEASNFLMGRTFLDIDMARAADLLGLDRRQAEMFRDLQRGHFVALGPALSRRPLPIIVGTVETHARGSTPKLSPLPETPAGDAKDLLLAPMPSARPAARRFVPPPPPPVGEVIAQIEREKPLDVPDGGAIMGGTAMAAEPHEAPPAAPSAAEVDALTTTILREVLEDPESFYRQETVLYQDFSVRWRIKRVRAPMPDLAGFRRALAVCKAGATPEIEDMDVWRTAKHIAASLTDDMQSVYLLLAKAAIAGEACPSDASLARVCGSRSAGRARSRIAYLEQQGFVVMRSDMRGRRIANLPDLEAETTSGDPNGPDLAQAV